MPINSAKILRIQNRFEFGSTCLLIILCINEIQFQTSYVNHSAELVQENCNKSVTCKNQYQFLWIFCIAYSALCINEMTLYAKSNVELTISCRILIARFRPESKLVEEKKKDLSWKTCEITKSSSEYRLRNVMRSCSAM